MCEAFDVGVISQRVTLVIDRQYMFETDVCDDCCRAIQGIYLHDGGVQIILERAPERIMGEPCLHGQEQDDPNARAGLRRIDRR